jgi:hypothetical protein
MFVVLCTQIDCGDPDAECYANAKVISGPTSGEAESELAFLSVPKTDKQECGVDMQILCNEFILGPCLPRCWDFWILERFGDRTNHRCCLR